MFECIPWIQCERMFPKGYFKQTCTNRNIFNRVAVRRLALLSNEGNWRARGPRRCHCAAQVSLTSRTQMVSEDKLKYERSFSELFSLFGSIQGIRVEWMPFKMFLWALFCACTSDSLRHLKAFSFLKQRTACWQLNSVLSTNRAQWLD